MYSMYIAKIIVPHLDHLGTSNQREMTLRFPKKKKKKKKKFTFAFNMTVEIHGGYGKAVMTCSRQTVNTATNISLHSYHWGNQLLCTQYHSQPNSDTTASF